MTLPVRTSRIDQVPDAVDSFVETDDVCQVEELPGAADRPAAQPRTAGADADLGGDHPGPVSSNRRVTTGSQIPSATANHVTNSSEART
jgi:hypothetical protein